MFVTNVLAFARERRSAGCPRCGGGGPPREWQAAMGNGSSKDHLGDSTLPEHVWAKAGGALAATERVERWKERAYAGLSQEERSAHYMELSGADHMRSVYDATHRKKGGSSGHYAALVGRLQHGRSGDEGKESKESKGGEEEKRSTGDRSPSSADHAGASHASKSIHLVDGHLTEQLSSKDAQLMTQVEKDIHRTAVALEKPSEDYDVRRAARPRSCAACSRRTACTTARSDTASP